MRFQYKAKKGPKDTVEGFLEADTRDQAVSQVMSMGLTPVSVMEHARPVSDRKISGPSRLSVKAGSLKDVVLFTRQMSDLTESSVPMLRALQIIIRQTSSESFRKILTQVHDAVRDGMSLSGALSRYSSLFPAYYVHMVRTGEMGGQLNVIFRRLAEALEKQHDMRLKIRSSLAYPMLILVVGIVTVFVLIAFVIPKISVMFEDLGQALPWPTVILLKMSAWLASFWWMVVMAVVLGIFAGGRWLLTEQGSRWKDGLALKIPAVGQFLKMAASAQFCRTLSTLLESGVPLNSALNAAAQTVVNAVFQSQVRDLSERVTKGESLSSGLRRAGFFPDMLVNMVAVGEETGQLEKSLAKAAESYERQTDETMRTVISLLGPAVLVVVVGIVGCVVLALLLPILQMNLLVQ